MFDFSLIPNQMASFIGQTSVSCWITTISSVITTNSCGILIDSLSKDRIFLRCRNKTKRCLWKLKTIGGRIAEARKKMNISQAQLAKQLFISAQAVGKWERGESMPDIIMLNRLAEILGVDLNYFSENFQPAEDEINENAGSSEGVEVKESGGREFNTNFSGRRLQEVDLAGVTAHKRKFKASALNGADFSGADLTGSSFAVSDVREANFDGANLTDCVLSTMDLTNANFNKSILVRTEFNKVNLTGAKFINIKLTDVKLTMSDLRKTIFENCLFKGVDFTYSDLRGVNFAGQSFIGVRFDKAALNDAVFKGSTLENVSFNSTFALTNKYYRGIKTIRFDGAKMDKLTYAGLKGLGADLSNVTFI